jgi:hypothetical protein
LKEGTTWSKIGGEEYWKKINELRDFFGSSPDAFIISILTSILSDGELGLSQKQERIALTFLYLHGHPIPFFLSLFMHELTSTKFLSSLMRERTPAVFLLQFIWKNLERTEGGHELLRLRKIVLSRRFQKRIFLLSQIDRSHSSKLDKAKKYLLHKLEDALDANLIPLPMRYLCRQCSHLIENWQGVVLPDGVSPLQWVIGAFLFLRYIVPCVTSLVSEDDRKHAVLTGRFLMKLACKALFHEESLLKLNDVLQEAYPLFDRFCSDLLKYDEVHMSSNSQMSEHFPPFLELVQKPEIQDFHQYILDARAKNLFMDHFESCNSRDTSTFMENIELTLKHLADILGISDEGYLK